MLSGWLQDGVRQVVCRRHLPSAVVPIEDTGIDPRGLHVLVAERVVNGPDAVAVLAEGHGEGMGDGLAGRSRGGGVLGNGLHGSSPARTPSGAWACLWCA